MRRDRRAHRAAVSAVVLAVVLALSSGCVASSRTSPVVAGKRPNTSGTALETSPTPRTRGASVTIGASGDLLAHAPVIRNAASFAGRAGGYDFAPMFNDVRGVISAPALSLCHLETPVTSTNRNLSQPRRLVFNSPHELVDAIKGAGYDGCDFASNHTWDQGLAGLTDTYRVFARTGVGLTGPPPTPRDAGQAQTYAVDGTKVAHLAYSYTIFNAGGPNKDVPSTARWLAKNLWPAAGATGIIEQARLAKERGADFVVVSLHWGAEYVEKPTADQRALARKLLSSDAVDLILGTHVHRVQPCQRINGKLVFYGLGNFLSNQSPDVNSTLLPQTQEGLFVRVSLTRGKDGKVATSAAYQPTYVDLAGHVIRKATKASRPVTFNRTTRTLNLMGGCELKAM